MYFQNQLVSFKLIFTGFKYIILLTGICPLKKLENEKARKELLLSGYI